MGIECQTCHMYPDSVTNHFAKFEVGGLERDPLTIPSHLQPGSRDPGILANSVSMRTSVDQVGDSIRVMVTITNDKTGHHVPTGRPSRNMILLVSAENSAQEDLEFIGGETVPWWGGQGGENGDFAGYPGKGFAKILEDFEGNAPSPAWRPNHILSDNRIPAFETDTSFYYFRAPDAPDQAVVTTGLLFRRFFKDWMDEKRFDIADIEMESDSIQLMITPVITEKEEARPHFRMEQNYPNPFNSVSVIQFAIDKSGHVEINIYDCRGRFIMMLADTFYSEGLHRVSFDAGELPNGLYIYEMRCNDNILRKKAAVLK